VGSCGIISQRRQVLVKFSNHPSVSEIEQFLIDRVAYYSGVSSRDVDPGEAFVDFGLGSKEAVLLSGDIAEWLRRDVSPTLVWEYPTITEVASFLAEPA